MFFFFKSISSYHLLNTLFNLIFCITITCFFEKKSKFFKKKYSKIIKIRGKIQFCQQKHFFLKQNAQWTSILVENIDLPLDFCLYEHILFGRRFFLPTILNAFACILHCIPCGHFICCFTKKFVKKFNFVQNWMKLFLDYRKLMDLSFDTNFLILYSYEVEVKWFWKEKNVKNFQISWRRSWKNLSQKSNF